MLVKERNSFPKEEKWHCLETPMWPVAAVTIDIVNRKHHLISETFCSCWVQEEK